ncbi:MAG: hypothetical protein HEQ16_05900 [Bosea sp.]|jgi:uncharacterized membrane protein|nr:hypothetical protein [Bosea sp. (in: a-proteobacteria)]
MSTADSDRAAAIATPPREPPRPPLQGQALRSAGLRLVHRLALFVALAGIAHLLTVLLIPRYAQRDAASVFAAAGETGRADLIAASADPDAGIRDADPLTAMAACGFDLEDGPFRITARTGPTPLSISLHLHGGGVFYAVTDRAALRGVIEFVVLDRSQYDRRVAADDDGEAQRELRVIAPARQGIVVARALVRQPSDRPLAEALVKLMACGAAG